MMQDGVPTRIAIPCRRCGCWLVAPESVDAQIGPVCAQHERDTAARAARELPLFDLEEMAS